MPPAPAQAALARLERSSPKRVLLAGATGVIGRQAVPVLAAAGHRVVGLARTPARLPGAEVVAADALDTAAVAAVVRSAAPDVIVHMLTAIPDPVDPRHLARDMAATDSSTPTTPRPPSWPPSSSRRPPGVLNVVDDQPTLVHDWLPAMAAMLGAPAPTMFPPGSPGCSPAGGWWPT
jgi:NAD(P)-dependent dehydrogenase (short-subunit alcohol dehydrogenase family)